jgi:hypothetical protein
MLSLYQSLATLPPTDLRPQQYLHSARGMFDLVLSLLMLTGIGLTLGGLYKLIALHDRKQGILMLIAALVMFANVAILLVPF